MSQHQNQIFAIVGPESTGKTTLCAQLAREFDGQVVVEASRSYLAARDGIYDEKDLLIIAKQQLQFEQDALRNSFRPIFCDTDILVILVWQQFKFGNQNPEIEALFRQQEQRKYLLAYPDLSWQPDPLRENQHELLELFHLYEERLNDLNVDFRVIRGKGEERQKNAIQAIHQLKLD